MREQGADRLVPVPDRGRVFTTARRVRFGDVSPAGHLRLDALACYLQDVSSDDTADAGLGDDPWWVVRRTAIEVRRPAGFRELLTVRTFCSGMGGRWAERRVSLAGDRGASLESATLWVRLDAATGRPAPLDAGFREAYEEAAGGREVTSRLGHDPEPPPGAEHRAWATRHVDLDPLGHVNNAASWATVEEARATRADLGPAVRAELEYRAPIEGTDRVAVAVDHRPDGFDLWVVAAEAPGPAPLTGRLRALG